MPNENLKPCPVLWCRSNSCDNYPPTVVRIAPMKYRPKCGWCGVSPKIDFITETEAIAAWNHRPGDAVIEAAQKVADAWHKRPHGLTVTNAIADSMDALAVLMPWHDTKETPNAQ